MRTFFFKKTPVNQKGFTLVELLVSIGIFSVITSIAVFNNAQFNSSILLTNLAYEVALSVRQAQVYGVTVKKDSEDNFTSAYGVHFDLATPTTYFLFQDTNYNKYYDIGDINIETFYLKKGSGITQFCVTPNDSSIACTSDGTSKLDVTFIRPTPDAWIKKDNGASQSKADICIVSSQGIKRKVVVENSGQISVSVDLGNACTP